MHQEDKLRLLFLLVQLLVPAKRGQITTGYSITGREPSPDSGIVIPPADSKSGQDANTGWGYFRAAIERKDDSPRQPRPSVLGTRSQVVVLQYTEETCHGSVDFASSHVGECRQE